MKFARIIKELREERHLSQEQLAHALGISQSAIAKWELDKTEPTASMLVALSKYFAITVGQLLGTEDY